MWDAENRLKWVCNTTPCTQGGAVASFLYDALGRRVEKVAGGVTTTYTYDGEDILRQVAGSSTLKYVHGPGVDEPLAQEDGGGVLSYFHADGLGSMVKTTSSAGAVTSTRRYDAFGTFELGAANGFAFTAREWDTETGLAYYRARYYDPKVGRFISEDPIKWFGGINLYAYVEDRPTGLRDPTGLMPGMGLGPSLKLAGIFGCAQAALATGHAAGKDKGYRYGHCIAACETSKCGLGRSGANLLGIGNEIKQTWDFFTVPNDNGHSAWGKPDLRDNDVGASCPAGRTCIDQCSAFIAPGVNPEKTEAEFGPLYHAFKWVLVPTAQ